MEVSHALCGYVSAPAVRIVRSIYGPLVPVEVQTGEDATGVIAALNKLKFNWSNVQGIARDSVRGKQLEQLFFKLQDYKMKHPEEEGDV
jgi:hypothetical protein